MPLSPPKVVVPLTACTDRVRLQGQKTGSTVRIYASPNNIFDKVCEATAAGPDQTFVLTRRLVAGEQVYATQTVPGDSAGSNVNREFVQPEPALSEIGPITADTHLHACGQCAAFGNGYPGAEVRIVSASQGPLGTAVVDPDTGAARVSFSSPLHQNESLSGSQSICGKTGPVRALPSPDLPASTQRRLPAPSISTVLHACERAVLVEGVSDGANVRLFRDGQEYASACFDYPSEWFRIRDPLKQGERITVDQRFLKCELFSDPSPATTVGPAQDVPAPVVLGRLCKGTRAIRLTGLRYGATVQIVQTNGSFVMGSTIAEAEAWDDTCDIPLTEPLDPVRGTKVIAVQILCSRVSPDSNTEEIHKLTGTLPPPTVVGPLFECGRMVRVSGIYPGARIEVYMSCANPPYIRLLAAQYVYDTRAELLVSPALVAHQRVFARQFACRQVSDSAPEPVQTTGDLRAPDIEDCGTHLHVTGVVPGARVEVYVNGGFFRSGRSGGSDVIFVVTPPLPAGAMIKARQLLCEHISGFSHELQIRDDVMKRTVTWVRTTRICQLTGNTDPEGKPQISNSVDAGITGTDLGIIVDHDTGDGVLYFFFGDTDVIEEADDFPGGGDCLAWSTSTRAEPNGPLLHFMHDMDDDEPVPLRLTIHDVSQGGFEVPTGGFSHNGRLYVFASTDHYTDTPITHNIGKDDNFMGRSVLASAVHARDTFFVVPGYDDISNHTREASGGFKFINIAPWKIRNDDWPHLPSNAVPGGTGLIIIGSGRYRESQPCLAYVPLPPGDHPQFSEWRYLTGFNRAVPGGGPCGLPEWSTRQEESIFLFNDSAFFAGNKGVVGELSLTFDAGLELWLLLYAGVVMRTAEYPWGPWSDPVPLFDFGRDHADPKNPSDPRPRFIQPDGGTYGPYMVPRFTQWDPWSQQATLYYAMSTWRPYQAMLMRTIVQLTCGYKPDIHCASR